MNDKTTPKTPPCLNVSIWIDIAPTDILPLLQKALTGAEIPKNDTQTIHKNQARRTPHEIYKK